MQIWTNKCPICEIEREYKTKQGWEKGKTKPCKSCSNSIQQGGEGNVRVKEGKKKCFTCNKIKDISKFRKRTKKHYHSSCRDCLNDYNEKYHKNYYRFQKYGIDKKEFNRLKKQQNNKCAICLQKEKLHIDHCHNSNEVRGLLCQKCNTAIGLLSDDVEILKRTINYLNKGDNK